MKQLLYIANLKSYFTYHQSIEWLARHSDELVTLSHQHKIVLCADFLTFATIQPKHSSLVWGAQNCSPYPAGAYTGEITAHSLKELGVSYCIVGHSERRRLFHETLEDCASKITLLYAHNIIPLICVSDAYKNELEYFLPKLPPKSSCIIAYEPVCAIGTGRAASPDQIESALIGIQQELRLKQNLNYSLLYGGSVNVSVAPELKKIKLLDGFLIGKASTDFQELKKIVECK